MHNVQRSQPLQNWLDVKAKIIARFGTVKACAALVPCHVNSLRYVGRRGNARRRVDARVAARLIELLAE